MGVSSAGRRLVAALPGQEIPAFVALVRPRICPRRVVDEEFAKGCAIDGVERHAGNVGVSTDRIVKPQTKIAEGFLADGRDVKLHVDIPAARATARNHFDK